MVMMMMDGSILLELTSVNQRTVKGSRSSPISKLTKIRILRKSSSRLDSRTQIDSPILYYMMKEQWLQSKSFSIFQILTMLLIPIYIRDR